MPDPIGSIYYEYFKTGKIPKGGNCNYLLEGIGEDHIAHAMDFSVVDEVGPGEGQGRLSIARLLARKKGF